MNDIELLVFDLNFSLLGEISEYKELTIERFYTKISRMTLRIAATKEIIELLKHNNILVVNDSKDKDNNDRFKYGYIIQYFYYTDEDETEVEVYAYSLNFLLSLRSIPVQQFYSGNVEDVIKSFININCINPTNENRVMQNLRLAPNNGIDVVVESSAFGVRLDEHCFSLCNENDMSIDILMNHEDKKFDVVTWQGLDKSVLQNENPHVMFSKEFDNIINQKYTSNITDHKTTAIVAGEVKEGNERTTVVVNDEKSGYERRELFIDSSLTSSYNDDNNNVVNLPEEEYKNILITEGREIIKEYPIVETFESEVDRKSQYVFGVDYNVGDKVSIKNDEVGKIMHTRVISAEIISDSNGIELNVNFGSNIPTLYEKFRKKVN